MESVCSTENFRIMEKDLNFIDQLFKYYILDTINALAHTDKNRLEKIELHLIFNLPKSDWKTVVKQAFDFSPTFNIAVKDAWYKALGESFMQGKYCDPKQFADDLMEEYYSEKGTIDIWDEGGWIDAILRIEDFEKNLSYKTAA